MRWRFVCSSVLVVAVLALSACSSGGGVPDEGSFSIDAYPDLVNTTPIAITGEKPAGYSVQVDGLERVAAGDGTTWEVSLDLAEGPNEFLFESVDPDGSAEDSETVSIVLDSIAPTLVGQVPEPDATGVACNVIVQVTFSEPVDCGTVTPSTFAIQGVDTSVQCSAGDPTVSLAPGAELDDTTEHTVTLFSDVADPAGNKLARDEVWRFTTGSGPDITPPQPPTADDPAPTSPTVNSTMQVGGWKEPGANVEFRWDVDGSERQDWTEVAGKNPDSSWTHTFALELGLNGFSLRSVDQANNVSISTTDFAVQRDPNPNQVNPPTVDPVVSPTSVGNQVLHGSKDPDTGILVDGLQVFPVDAGDRWDALVFLAPGQNTLSVVASDASGNFSDPVDVEIAYNPPGQVPAPGQLQIEFDLRDMWNYLGDEMYYRDVGHGVEINHFGVDIWVEGPITQGEACVFNEASKQRRHTRYVATVVHGVDDVACGIDPVCDEWCPCSGWWDFENYRVPNYLAALIESGQWAGSTWPIPGDVQRRDPATGEQWPGGLDGNNQPLHPELHYPDLTPWSSWVSRTRMAQEPYVDGVTEATVDPDQNPAGGAPLGTWVGTRTYTWDLTDASGAPIEQGPYLVSIVVTLDRARNGSLHFSNFLLLDRETCWDDPAHDTRGVHRAEGIITLGGSETEIYLYEKGHAETVDACRGTDQPYPGNLIRCNCVAGDLWPCPETPVSDPSLVGERILYMNPDKFPDPVGDGNNYAVKVRYCPGSPCQ